MDTDTLTKALIFENWLATLPQESIELVYTWLDNICEKTDLYLLEAEALLADLFCLVAHAPVA